MKSIIACRAAGLTVLPVFLVLLVLTAHSATAQFNGTLIYQMDPGVGPRLVTKYYQNGTHGKIEAYTVRLKNGIPDSTTMHAQDTIIFDFSAATETHLQYKTMMAYKQKYIANMISAAMQAKLAAMGTTSASSVGPDTTNGYQCNHYVITTTSKLGTGTRDIWMTGSLGGTPTVWVVGSFLYFPPGYPHLVKLQAAGASGVVVKVNSSFTKQGLQYSMRLISVDTHPPRLQFFDVPSRYTVIDETNMTMPSQ